MRWRLTWRDILPLIVASASLRRGAAMSLITTGTPASAQTWAIPLPIWPAPMIPTLRMLCAMILVRNLRISDFQRLILLLYLSQFRLEFRQRLVQVGHQSIVGDLEDRRFLVLIDSNNHLGVFHPGEMLNCAGNSDCDVELGRYHLAGLADLPVVRRVTGIDCGTRGADAGAQCVRHRFDIFAEVVAALHGAAAGDDD